MQLIVARSSNNVIGSNGDLPWHIPEDLAFFKKTTLGASVIMGRKTYESVGFPLPKRRNIVVTRQADYKAPGCEIAASLHDAIALCADDPSCFLCGGARIYQEGLPLVQTMYITEVDLVIEGDTVFPDFNLEDFDESTLHSYSNCGPNSLSITIKKFERRTT